jgi:hypothetical protein
MEKIIYIQPRQTGKTTMGMFEYLKSPDSTLIITLNNSTVDHLIRSIRPILSGRLNMNITTEHQFLMVGDAKKYRHTIKTIILDEYMFFKNKEKMYNTINELNPERLLIYSTSDKTYSKKIIDLIKHSKANDLEVINTTKEFHELYYNFITDPDSVIHDDMSRSNIKYKHMLQPGRYEIEFENKYLIDDGKFRPNRFIYLVI